MATFKHWIEFSPDWRLAPMAYWVHVEKPGERWRDASAYTPPAPVYIPHKGFAVICVDFRGFVLRFSSRDQLVEFARVLSLKPVPPVTRLVRQRGSRAGLNSHWLSRLPADLKSPRHRAKLVLAIHGVLAETAAT